MTFLIPCVGASLYKVYMGGNSSNAFTTNFTYPAQAIGVAHPERRIILATATNITSCSVGGISATQVVNSSGNLVQIWIVHVPLGTTGTVVCAASVNQNGNGVNWYAVYPVAPVTVDTSGTPGAITADETGFVIAGAYDAFGGGTSISFTGGVTQDGTVTWPNKRHSVASADNASGTLTLGVVATSGSPGLAAASFSFI